MNPEELLAIARRALAAGEDSAAVDKAVHQVSGMSLAELEQSLKPKTGLEPIIPLATTFGMGATMGWLDDMLANFATGGTGPLMPEKYQAIKDAIRAPYEKARKDYPAASLVTEMAGGLMLPVGGAAAGIGRIGLLRSALRGLLTGATSGTVAGAGYAPTPGDIPGQAARGAVVGGLVGGAVPFGTGVTRRLLSSARLPEAIASEGGEDVVRAAAQKAVQLDRPEQPIAALGPYLRSEAEHAATRSPYVYATYQPVVAQQRAGEAGKLISGVVKSTAEPKVYGRTAVRGQRAVAVATGHPENAVPVLESARAEHFDPIFEAMEKKAKTILDPRLPEILARPYVAQAFKGSVAEQLMTGTKPINVSHFRALKTLWEELDDAADEAFKAGIGHRGAALRKAANDVEQVLADNVDDFRAVRQAYKTAKRPMNIIDLAGLETARKGRSSPTLDRAGIDFQRDLQKAFGSQAKYKDFMERVTQAKNLADLDQQAFGGPATARRLLGTPSIGPEQVAEFGTKAVAVKPWWALASIVGRFLPRHIRERAARRAAPLLFSPAIEVDRVLEEIARQQASQMAGPIESFALPAYAGLLGGR